ncbi:MAG: hypothetical protein HY788_03690 [Deltaproteobacteria bacterium]|nr:hypothetical protein [Deltaproteobacteria bacterium]
MEWTITRRDFMRGTAFAALGAALPLRVQAETTTRVVLVRDKDVFDENGRIDGGIVQRMLDDAMTAVTQKANPAEAFAALIRPEDIVGVKSNGWSYMPTPPELEAAIERRLLDVGVKKDHISIDDRGVLTNPVFKQCTAIINVGLVCNLPMVKGKLRLHILSALGPLFHGRGPHHYDQRYVWKYNGIIVGTDPVAVDAVGLELIRQKRREHFGKELAFPTIPKHVALADTRHHMGISDLNRIELVKVGWEEGRLIACGETES